MFSTFIEKFVKKFKLFQLEVCNRILKKFNTNFKLAKKSSQYCLLSTQNTTYNKVE